MPGLKTDWTTLILDHFRLTGGFFTPLAAALVSIGCGTVELRWQRQLLNSIVFVAILQSESVGCCAVARGRDLHTHTHKERGGNSFLLHTLQETVAVHCNL
jgi:hypothetical protein